jgi:hypothetical protein
MVTGEISENSAKKKTLVSMTYILFIALLQDILLPGVATG